MTWKTWSLSGAAALVVFCLVLSGAVKARAGEERPIRKQVVVVKGGGEDGPGLVWSGPVGKRGYLGVGLVALTPELRAHFGAPEDAGLMVSRVEADSPAAGAGIAVGDILIAAGGEPVTSIWGLQRVVGRKKAGERLGLGVVRERAVHGLTATIQERERPQVELGHVFEGLCPGGECRGFDAGAFDEAMERFREQFGDAPGVKAKVFKLREAEGELQERLEELEKRLEELEERLQGRRGAGGSRPT